MQSYYWGGKKVNLPRAASTAGPPLLMPYRSVFAGRPRFVTVSPNFFNEDSLGMVVANCSAQLPPLFSAKIIST